MTFDALLKQLPSLTDDQLRQVELRIKFLRKNPAGVPVTVTPIDGQLWLLQGVLNVVRRRGLVRASTPIEVCRKIAPNCETVASEVQGMLLEGASRPLTPPECYALGVAAAEALASYLSFSGALGLKRMLINLAKAPDAFDASFPGYLEAGLVTFIVSRRA